MITLPTHAKPKTPDPILTGTERPFTYNGREHYLYNARLDPTSFKGHASSTHFYLITDSGEKHLLLFEPFVRELKAMNNSLALEKIGDLERDKILSLIQTFLNSQDLFFQKEHPLQDILHDYYRAQQELMPPTDSKDPTSSQAESEFTTTKPRPQDLTEGVRGFDCGMCGNPVKPRRMSKKPDGWHWHKDCWENFPR